MEDRLIKLEMLFMEQGCMQESLSAEVARQQQDITRMKLRITNLEEKLAALSDPNPIGGHERPPHY
jgi:uncharacterized coiled-coil protein SlyX